MNRSRKALGLAATLALVLGWWIATRDHVSPTAAHPASGSHAGDGSHLPSASGPQVTKTEAPTSPANPAIAWTYEDVLLEMALRYDRFATERELTPEQAANLFELLAERHVAALHGTPHSAGALGPAETAQLLAQLLGPEAAAELAAYDRAFTQEASAREGLDRLYAVGPVDERAARALYHELLHWDFDRDLRLVVDRGQPITPDVSRNLEQEHFARLQGLLARVGPDLSPQHRDELYQWSHDRFSSRLHGARARVAREADMR